MQRARREGEQRGRPNWIAGAEPRRGLAGAEQDATRHEGVVRGSE